MSSDDDDDFGLEGDDLLDADVGGDLELDGVASAPAGGRKSSTADDDGSLFSNDDADLEIDATPPARNIPASAGPPARVASGRSATSAGTGFSDPSISLDAEDMKDYLPAPRHAAPRSEDQELAGLLGDSIATAAPLPLPLSPTHPAPGPPTHMPAAPSYGLADEDSELAELLGDNDDDDRRPPPLPPAPPSRTAPLPAPRQVSFAQRQPERDSMSSGLLDDDIDSEVARIASFGRPGSAAAPARSTLQAQRSPAPSVPYGNDDLEDDSYDVEDDARPAAQPRPPATAAAPFRRVPAAAPPPPARGSANVQEDSYGDDSFDLQPARAAPARPSARAARHSDYTDDSYDDGWAQAPAAAGAAFRRVPATAAGAAAAPGAASVPAAAARRADATAPPRPRGDDGHDNYDDDDGYDDGFDDFADDLSWDGEVRGTSGAYRGVAVREGSPRGGSSPRRRPLSAMTPRERQAALLNDMMSRHPSTWDVREVAAWVDFIGMGQYRLKFIHHSVDGSLLLELGDGELARDLRILPLGHRKALLGAIAQLKEAAAQMEKQRGLALGMGPGSLGRRGKETDTVARADELRRRGAAQGASRKPSSAGPNIIPAEPFLGPATGKITVYEQRAKLLFHLDKARTRAAQHQAIISQLANNKALTEKEMATLRGQLQDLELKHKDLLTLTPGAGPPSPGRHNTGGGGAAADAAAAEAVAVPWHPVGSGTKVANRYPERLARPGEDPTIDNTFVPRVTRLHEVPIGTMNVRDVVAKALGSRQPFWRRMEFEFNKMQEERDAKDEARRKRRERMGRVKKGPEGEEDDDKTKSRYWNNYWVPGSSRNDSTHKRFSKTSENAELVQYRSFAQDKQRLSRWFRRFVDESEGTEGDVTLERLINRMVKALMKTQGQVDEDFGESGDFAKKVRAYFKERGFKFDTVVSNTIMVRAHGSPAPMPKRPDNTLYDFEELEQYYPDYLRKKNAGADEDLGGGGDGDEGRMVPQRTTWKRLVEILYMDRQKKIKSAIGLVKMAQFVQRNGARWAPERQRGDGDGKAWLPNSAAGALHQLDGRDRTFNAKGQDQIGLQVKLKKVPGVPQPMTFQMKVKAEEEKEAKADEHFAKMGWPHSSGDDLLSPPPPPPLLSPGRDEFGLGGGIEGDGEEDDFGLDDEDEEGAGGGRRQQRGRGTGAAAGAALGAMPRMDFWQAMDLFLDLALDLRRQHDRWAEARRQARNRGQDVDDLPQDPPSVDDIDWGGRAAALSELQEAALVRARERWLVGWEAERQSRERRRAQFERKGYPPEEIDKRLGKQVEASEVEAAVHDALRHSLGLMSRVKAQELRRIRDSLQGTKKKMAVYRALCTQEFLDETAAKQAQRTASLKELYATLAPSRRKVIGQDRVDKFLGRLQANEKMRTARLKKLEDERVEEELSHMTPWFELHPPSAPPSPGPASPGGPSRTTSPNRPAGGGGPAEGDSPAGATPAPGGAQRQSGRRQSGAGMGGGRGPAPGTPSRQRPASAGPGARPGAGRPAAGSRPQSPGPGPRQAPATPRTRPARGQEEAVPGAAAGAAARQRPSSARTAPLAARAGGATPTQAGRGRPAGGAASPAAAAQSGGGPPSAQRPSSSGRPSPGGPAGGAGRGRGAAAAEPAAGRGRRRGLMDDSTTGPSTSPSPSPGRSGAGRGGGPGPGRGLADTSGGDSSPSPRPRGPQPAEPPDNRYTRQQLREQLQVAPAVDEGVSEPDSEGYEEGVGALQDGTGDDEF